MARSATKRAQGAEGLVEVVERSVMLGDCELGGRQHDLFDRAGRAYIESLPLLGRSAQSATLP
jgi:hypothetical protein